MDTAHTPWMTWCLLLVTKRTVALINLDTLLAGLDLG